MGDKTLIPVVTSLALMQLQSMPYCSYWSVRRLVPRLRKTSQQLIREGVQTVGVETMEGIKSRLYEGILQQDQKDKGNGHH